MSDDEMDICDGRETCRILQRRDGMSDDEMDICDGAMVL